MEGRFPGGKVDSPMPFLGLSPDLKSHLEAASWVLFLLQVAELCSRS